MTSLFRNNGNYYLKSNLGTQQVGGEGTLSAVGSGGQVLACCHSAHLNPRSLVAVHENMRPLARPFS